MAYLLRQPSECLASGSTAAFKRTIIGVEGGQREVVLLGVGLDIREASLKEEGL
jgi:hypothetical protein